MTAQLASESHTHPSLSALRQQMTELFEGGFSNGCALSVYHKGDNIAQLWGGFSDRELEMPWQKDTLVNVFSASKGILSAAILRLIESKQLDPDAPIARYWPAFANGGKHDITTREVLSHRAGLCAFTHFIPREDCYLWPDMKRHVERMQPIADFRGKQAYAPFTFGWILGGLIEALTDTPPQQHLTQLCKQHQIDYHLGLSDTAMQRTAPVQPKPSPDQQKPSGARKPQQKPDATAVREADQKHFQRALDQQDWRTLAFENPRSLAGGSNSSVWRRAGVPAAGGHCSADALARFYMQLSPGSHNKKPIATSITGLNQPWSESDKDACTCAPMAFAGGFMFSQHGDAITLTPQGTAIGHAGAGGSLGLLDIEHDIAIGFVTRDLSPGLLAGGKAQKLIRTLYNGLHEQALI